MKKLIILPLLMLSSLTFAATMKADEFIDNVFQKVQTKVDGKEQKPEFFIKLAEEEMIIHLDMEKMTASTMGIFWRQTDDPQKKQLVNLFTKLVTRTYAGALSEIKGRKLKIKPIRSTGEETVVKTEVVKNGDPINLDYKMSEKNDQWKIHNINVMGIWLVDTYKSQFSPILQKDGIDGLIKHLESKFK